MLLDQNHRSCYIYEKAINFNFPQHTERKLNVHETFKRSLKSSERLLYVQFTSSVQKVRHKIRR